MRLIDTEVDNHFNQELERQKHNDQIKMAELVQQEVIHNELIEEIEDRDLSEDS